MPVLKAQTLYVPNGTSGIGISTNGNVGIGTSLPAYKLELNGTGTNAGIHLLKSDGVPASWYIHPGRLGNGEFSIGDDNQYRLVIGNQGNIGVGTTNPSAKLEVYNIAQSGHLLLSTNDNPSADATRIDIDFKVADRGHTVGRIASYYDNSAGGGYGGLRFYTRYAGFLNERFRISSNGNILIGKTTQANADYKLDVAGKVRADEITVNTSGADFVFEKGYNLRPLTEVEAYVKENKHLPDVAPAAEMQTNGVSVGEMNAKLLQKVEELTLYLIEKDKKIEDLQKQINEIKFQLKK